MILFNTSLLYGSYGNNTLDYNMGIHKIIGETVLKKPLLLPVQWVIYGIDM